VCVGSLRYDLDEPLPDHSSLTRICTRYGVEMFRCFFETIVDQCQRAGLLWGKELYVDATKVQANASMESVKPRFAVDSHLRALFATEEQEEPELAADAESSPLQAKLKSRLQRGSMKRHLHPARHQCLPPLSVNPLSRPRSHSQFSLKLLSVRT
jgi:hypothetical protein